MGWERWAGLLACWSMFTTCKHTQAQKKILREFFKAVFFLFFNVTKPKCRVVISGKRVSEQGELCNLSTYVCSLCVPAFVIIHLLRLPTLKELFCWAVSDITNLQPTGTNSPRGYFPQMLLARHSSGLLAGLGHRTVRTIANLQIMLS